MNRPIIRVSSVTYAMRGQKMLAAQGIWSRVMKLAKDINVKGCGYGLEVGGNVWEAKAVLDNAGIRVLEVIGG